MTKSFSSSSSILSSEMNFIDATRFKIIVPESVLAALNILHSKISDASLEFGMYLKANINVDTGEAIILPIDLETGENIEVPNQRVTQGSISFGDDGPSDSSFNTVIHRHPAGCRTFSGTDMSSINQEFDVSLIFIPNATGGSFPDSLINIRQNDDSFLRVKVTEANVVIRKEAQTFTFLEAAAKRIKKITIQGVKKSAAPKTYGNSTAPVTTSKPATSTTTRPTLRRQPAGMGRDDVVFGTATPDPLGGAGLTAHAGQPQGKLPSGVTPSV